MSEVKAYTYREITFTNFTTDTTWVLKSDYDTLQATNTELKEMLIGKIMDENHDEVHPTTARAMAEAEIDEMLSKLGGK